ncbi:hypothetical protein TNCT_52751 [Trichonephila clavata]|uniref:Uncharacterized protein n=1 Tax=Trichonephila clavata TaxID=2740835 RepID=A0A8X6GDD3_TRICU|nr:hypothetical protein TNCT_52751 [Trichonephila clavata]
MLNVRYCCCKFLRKFLLKTVNFMFEIADILSCQNNVCERFIVNFLDTKMAHGLELRMQDMLEYRKNEVVQEEHENNEMVQEDMVSV